MNLFDELMPPITKGFITPIDFIDGYFVKRDDLFKINGVAGGKVRTCLALAERAKAEGYLGLTTAGSRQSPQVNIVAHIAQHLGMKCHIHTPQGVLSDEVNNAIAAGAVITQHKAGYNSVIIARARADAKANHFAEIPFGMECDEAIRQTRFQCRNIPKTTKNIIIPVGSGMSVSGILHGLNDCGLSATVTGVAVGASPLDRINKYAPYNWRDRLTLITPGVDYHKAIEAKFGDVKLDPIYEAKIVPFIKPDDLIWIIGCRQTYL